MLRSKKEFSPHSFSPDLILSGISAGTLLSEGAVAQARALAAAEASLPSAISLLLSLPLPPDPIPLETLLYSQPPAPLQAAGSRSTASCSKSKAKYRAKRAAGRAKIQEQSSDGQKAHVRKHALAAEGSAIAVPSLPCRNAWTGERSEYNPKIYSTKEVFALSGLSFIEWDGR